MASRTIYLTDQPLAHGPDIRGISHEIMFSVAGFYNQPDKARNFRSRFTDSHRLAQDSGGFQFLMGKLPLHQCDPMRTVNIYRKIGITRRDLPIQLDLPPRFALSKKKRVKLITKSAEFYHTMTKYIDWTVPVVHGWTEDELNLSLELIQNPDKFEDRADSPRTNRIEPIATPNNGDPPSTIVVDHMKSGRLAVGSFSSPSTVVVDHVHSKVAVGSFFAAHTNNFVMDRLDRKPVAVGSFQVSGATELKFAGGKDPRITANRRGHSNAQDCSGQTVNGKHCISTPGCTAEQVVQKTPLAVIWERLALVLNMFRDSELFVLGASSPNDQHIIFAAGAQYGDTSAWRLKAYLGEIYVPERGAVCIGHKGKPEARDADLNVLRECLRDATHPFCGMDLNRFLAIGKMDMGEWRSTLKENQWEAKPFNLRAAHNAWVLKAREEQIARDRASDPDGYHKYLVERFSGHPNLTRKMKFIWSRLKRPYVQSNIEVFLKGVEAS